MSIVQQTQDLGNNHVVAGRLNKQDLLETSTTKDPVGLDGLLVKDFKHLPWSGCINCLDSSR